MERNELATDLVGVLGDLLSLVLEREALLVELGEGTGMEVDEARPLGWIHLGSGRVLASCGQTLEHLAEGLASCLDPTLSAAELLGLALKGPEAIGQGGDLLVGDLGGLHGVWSDVY